MSNMSMQSGRNCGLTASLLEEEPMVFSPVNALENTGVPQSDEELLAADSQVSKTNDRGRT
jgi:hypothetical protein